MFIMYILISVIVVLIITIVILYKHLLQKAIKKKEKYQDHFLKKVFDLQPNIVITTDGVEIKNVNNQFLKFFSYDSIDEFKKEYHCICNLFFEKEGYLKAKYEEKTWVDYIHEHEDIVNKALIKNNNKEHEFIVNASKFELDENNISIVVFIDITQLLYQEEMLIRQEKRALMGDMLENIAYQWRDPLSTISMCASGMRLKQEMDNLSSEEFFKMCDSIGKSTQYLSQTIDDFRSYYDKNSCNGIFQLRNIIDDVIKMYEAQFINKKIEVINNCIHTNINGIKNELLQVMMNLITNAIDELDKIDTEKLIMIESRLINSGIQIHIQDNAGGVPEYLKESIFEKYLMANEENLQTSIGLFASKQIIENHFRGKMYVQNKEFQHQSKAYIGACFTIELSCG